MSLGKVPNGDFIILLVIGIQFQMREPKMCQIVCKATIDEKAAKELKEKIEDEYRVNM